MLLVMVFVREEVRWFERFEGERKLRVCRSASSSSVRAGLSVYSLSRSEFWYEAARGGVYGLGVCWKGWTNDPALCALPTVAMLN